MRFAISFAALLFMLSISAGGLSAQGRGNGHAKQPVQSPSNHGGGKPADMPKHESGAKTPKTNPGSTTTTHGKGNPHTTSTASGAVTPATIATISTTTPTTQSAKNPKLEARLRTLLPTGTNVQDAATGFKNWGQFVAAVHVSNNLHIPFSALKARMTGASPMSLGQAIQSLRSSSSVTTGTSTTRTTPITRTIRTEVNRAEQEAAEDLRRARDDRP